MIMMCFALANASLNLCFLSLSIFYRSQGWQSRKEKSVQLVNECLKYSDDWKQFQENADLGLCRDQKLESNFEKLERWIRLDREL